MAGDVSFVMRGTRGVSPGGRAVGAHHGVLPFRYAIFKAHVWRWWVSGIRFGDVRFESKLSAIALVDLYWIVIGWSWAITVACSLGSSAIFGIVYLSVTSSGAGPEAFATIAQNPVAVRADHASRSFSAIWPARSPSAWSFGCIFVVMCGRGLPIRPWSTIWRRPTMWSHAATW